MGIFNTLRYSSKAAELIEVIEVLWVKLKSYHKEHFSCIYVSNSEAERLGLYNGVPTNGGTQKMLEYMDRLPKWSNILNSGREFKYILICEECYLNTFLKMNKEFSSNLNTYLSLVQKMDNNIPANIKDIIQEYNEMIEDIQYLKIFKYNPL